MQLDEAIRITRMAAGDARFKAKQQRCAGLDNFARSETEKAKAFETVCDAMETARDYINGLKSRPILTGDEPDDAGKVNPLPTRKARQKGK